MSLNSVAWLRAQELLLRLVQSLTPLTEREETISSILTKRFFIKAPYAEPKRPIQSSVSILSNLHSEVKKLIEELPVPKEERAIAVLNKSDVPIRRQAQKLIAQVQSAIGKLCHSANMKDPKEEPLREALKQLQPDLEMILESVSEQVPIALLPLEPKPIERKKKKRKDPLLREKDEPST